MADFVFELGFDWNMPSTESSLGVIYPLQMTLVKNGTEVISACHCTHVNKGDSLRFHVFDITGSPVAPTGVVPKALQVLFTSATHDLDDFSPILDAKNDKVPQLATTEFPTISTTGTTSAAYGDVARAWDVTTEPDPLILKNDGRFELRALLTVAVSGTMAKFYRVDPEMVIGSGGTGPGTD